MQVQKKNNKPDTELIVDEDMIYKSKSKLYLVKNRRFLKRLQSLLNNCTNIICSHKNDINYSYNEIMSLSIEQKKERTMATDFLKFIRN